MAKLERRLKGDFDQVLARLERGLLEASMSATVEDQSDMTQGPVRVAVRMYERYSWLGSNRVALSLTLVGEGDDLTLCAITAGGSQAMFVKINTWGEEAFLETLEKVVNGICEERGV